MSRVLDSSEVSFAPTSSEVTALTPPEEMRFQRWIASNKITDLDHPDSHYDYRGYWKEHGDQPVRFGVDHFTDTYKQHGHPTFSVESIYAHGPEDAGRWEGETFIPPTKGAIVDPSEVSFEPAPTPPNGLNTGTLGKTIDVLSGIGNTFLPSKNPVLTQPLSKSLGGLTGAEAAETLMPEKVMPGRPQTAFAYDVARRGLKTAGGFLDWLQSPLGIATSIAHVASEGADAVLAPILGAKFTTEAYQSGKDALNDMSKNGATPENVEQYLSAWTQGLFGAAFVKTAKESATPRPEVKVPTASERRLADARVDIADQQESLRKQAEFSHTPEATTASPETPPAAVDAQPPESVPTVQPEAQSAIPEARAIAPEEVSFEPTEQVKAPEVGVAPEPEAPIAAKPEAPRESTIATFHEDTTALKTHPARPPEVTEGPEYDKFEERIRRQGESVPPEQLADYIIQLRKTAELHAPDNPTVMEHIENAEEALQSGDPGTAAWEAEQARGKGGLSTEYQSRVAREAFRRATGEEPPQQVSEQSEPAKPIDDTQEIDALKQKLAELEKAAERPIPPKRTRVTKKAAEADEAPAPKNPRPPKAKPEPKPRTKPDTPWADNTRHAQEQLKRGESSLSSESNTAGKEIEEEANAKANSIRSLGVKEGTPLAKFTEPPGTEEAHGETIRRQHGAEPDPEALTDAIVRVARQMHGEDPEALTSPVTIENLRKEFPGVSKEVFDRAVYRLAENENVWMHRQDHPLPDAAEQAANHVSANGQEYVAVSLRDAPQEDVSFDFGDNIIAQLDEAAERTKADIKAKITSIASGQTLGANLPAALLADFVKYGAIKIAKGSIKFGQWSKEMIEDFGETVRPHLGRIYNKAFKDAQELKRTNAAAYAQPEKALDVITKPMTGIADQIRSTFVPASASQSAGDMGLVVRRGAADLAARDTRANEALKGARRYFDKLDEPKQMDFIHAVETGDTVGLAPKEAQFADQMRTWLDATWKEVRQRSGVTTVIEDYFPHMWADPLAAEAAMRQFYAKRPLEGRKGFLKRREIMTVKEGLDAGLKLAVTNPVDIVLTQLHQENKFITGHDMVQEMKGRGLLQFRKAGTKTSAQGLVQINDSLGTVYGPPTAAGVTIRGYWMAPAEAARIINNYLGPGLAGNPLFDAFRATGNTLNQSQLGLSGFHFTFTAVDGSISKFGSGLQDLVSARGGLRSPTQALRGLGKMASGLAGIGPVAAAPWDYYIKGSKVLREFYRAGGQGDYYKAVIRDLIPAGGAVEMDSFYRNSSVEKFWDAWHKGSVSAPFRAIPAVIEWTSKPLMNHWVPRVKLGVFAELSRQMLADLPLDADPMLIRKTLAQGWDSVDNRMGQLRYDNLHWSRTLKDLGMASVRSLGWNIGTIRELGGAGVDVGKALVGRGNAFQSGGFQLTPRMAYAISLPIVVGMQGAMLMYLMTGKSPQELRDYFYPRTGKITPTGEPERVALPSYNSQLYSLGHDFPHNVVPTMSHKLNPQVSFFYDMIQNKDFYGTEIRHEDDHAVQQVRDTMMYVAKQFVPFSIRNLQERVKAGGGAKEVAESFMGVVPAPKSLEQSKAERLAQKYATAKAAQGSRTKEQFDRSQLRNEITRAFQAKDPTAGQKEAEALKAGKLSKSDTATIKANVKRSPIERSMQTASLEELLNVWDVADKAERRQLAPMIAARSRSSSLTSEMRDRLMPRVKAALSQK